MLVTTCCKESYKDGRMKNYPAWRNMHVMDTALLHIVLILITDRNKLYSDIKKTIQFIFLHSESLSSEYHRTESFYSWSLQDEGL